MPMMKALRAFTYAQQPRRKGDRFNVNSQHHIMALVAAKLAVVDADEPAVQTHYIADAYTAAEPAPIVPPKRGRGRPKGTGGTYKRRDLVAE